MKKSFLLCILFITSHWSEAQTYHSFLHDTAIWDEGIIIPGFCNVDNNTATGYDRKLIMEGDTIIHNMAYKKIYDQIYYYFFCDVTGCSSGFENLPPVLVGAVREDSLKRVYFLNFDSLWFDGYNATACTILHLPSNTELLLYDFNLHVGDSLPWKTYNKVVDGIDSIETENGIYLKAFYFNSNADYWVEGFGSNAGFFGAYLPEPFECTCDLMCAQATEYLLPGQKPCGGIYNSVQQPSENSQLVVFPNPAHDKINIAFPALTNHHVSISILNEMGQVVWMKNEGIVHGNFTQEIPVSDFPRGIYFIQIMAGKEVFGKTISMQ